MNSWLKNAVFYEIYPTSFKDSNSDGIGDFKGITSKLEYVRDMGFNAIWLNPFYKSPFKDGGYDVSDFFAVDPIFGTMDDFKELLNKAHELGIRIIVDLVAGHVSEQNEMFQMSAKAERNEYSDMFIWNNSVWDLEQPYRLISGRYDRNGCYMVNFFSTQPALNFGFNEITHPKWQMSYKDERTFKARNFLKDVMKFWLSLGADGFRVDMADSLVKNDHQKLATMEIWEDIIQDVKKEYPEMVLVSEWCNPDQALKCGFDCDFVLDHWDNFCHYLGRATEQTIGLSVLNGARQDAFKSDLYNRIEAAKRNNGLLGIITGNHDCPRIATHLDDNKLKLFYMIHFTLPGVPYVYYGDEIGMKHIDLPSKHGGYQRTGERTPMKWDNSKNKGFSNYEGELYLPLDGDESNVEDQQKDPNSILNFIKKMILIRKENEAFTSDNFNMYHIDDYIISYQRENIKIIINLSQKELKIDDLNETIMVSNEEGLNGNILLPNTGIIYR